MPLAIDTELTSLDARRGSIHWLPKPKPSELKEFRSFFKSGQSTNSLDNVDQGGTPKLGPPFGRLSERFYKAIWSPQNPFFSQVSLFWANMCFFYQKRRRSFCLGQKKRRIAFGSVHLSACARVPPWQNFDLGHLNFSPLKPTGFGLGQSMYFSNGNVSQFWIEAE